MSSFAFSGCGTMLQSAAGWKKTETVRKDLTHDVLVRAPEGSSVKRSQEKVLMRLPEKGQQTDRLTYHHETEITTPSISIVGIVGIGSIILSAGILVAAGNRDLHDGPQCEPVPCDPISIAAGAIPVAVSALVDIVALAVAGSRVRAPVRRIVGAKSYTYTATSSTGAELGAEISYPYPAEVVLTSSGLRRSKSSTRAPTYDELGAPKAHVEQLRREAQEIKRHAEQLRREARQARAEQLRREAEQIKRDAEQLRRVAHRARAERLRRKAERMKRDAEQLRRKAQEMERKEAPDSEKVSETKTSSAGAKPIAF